MENPKKGAFKPGSKKTPDINLQGIKFPVKQRATFLNTKKGDILVRLPISDDEFITRAYVREKDKYTVVINMYGEDLIFTQTGFDTDTFFHADPEDILRHNNGTYFNRTTNEAASKTASIVTNVSVIFASILLYKYYMNVWATLFFIITLSAFTLINKAKLF